MQNLTYLKDHIYNACILLRRFSPELKFQNYTIILVQPLPYETLVDTLSSFSLTALDELCQHVCLLKETLICLDRHFVPSFSKSIALSIFVVVDIYLVNYFETKKYLHSL